VKIPFTLDFVPGRDEFAGLLCRLADGEMTLELSKANALREYKAGKLSSVQWTPIVYVHDLAKLKKSIVFEEAELETFAKSFEGQPFLKDHGDAYEDRGGTILASELVERNGKKAIKQRFEAVKPWAIEGYLDGTIDRYSIGWDAQEFLCTVCGGEYGGSGCRHDFFDVGRKDKQTGEKVKVLMKGLEGIETSAVIRPASAGTGNEEFSASLKALSQMRKDASGISLERKEEVVMQKILQMLGLPATADEQEAQTALEALRSKAEKPGVPKALCTALGLPEDSPEDQVVAAVLAMMAPGAFVAKAEHDAVVEKLANFEAGERVRNAKARGKITPAMEAWAQEFAKRDPKSFDSYIAQAPVQVPLPGSGVPVPTVEPPKPATGAGMSEDELFVARRSGQTPEEFAKSKAEMEAYERRIAAVN
jgi:Mu-like prophage I protein